VDPNRNVLWIRVTLHKVPEKLIVFDAFDDRLHVDSLKWSKKFLLDMPYPDGITVDGAAADATLEFGILKVKIPIKDIGTTQITKTKNGRERAAIPGKRKRADAMEEDDADDGEEAGEGGDTPSQSTAPKQAKKKKKGKALAQGKDASLAIMNQVASIQEEKLKQKKQNETARVQKVEVIQAKKQQQKEIKSSSKEALDAEVKATLAKRAENKKAAKHAAKQAAEEEVADGKKRKRVSFGSLDVENPDQVRMDAEAKTVKMEKQAVKKARKEVKRNAKLAKKASPKAKKRSATPKSGRGK